MATQTPSVGRIVHVRFKDRCQAAVIVRAWSETTVNLIVFRDGSNDAGDGGNGSDATRWMTSATLDETATGHHWHWPERVE